MATTETLGSTTYKISGYDRKTGKSAVLVVEAASQAAALQQASSRGMAVAACEALKTPKAVPAKMARAPKAEAASSRLPAMIIGFVAVVATGTIAFVLGRRGEGQQPAVPLPAPASVVAKADAATALPPPTPQPKGLQLHGTPDELKQFGFLAEYDEKELPQQFKGYVALLSSEADRLMTAKAFDETVDGNKAYVMWFTVNRTEVVRTTSLDSPYRGVVTGTGLPHEWWARQGD